MALPDYISTSECVTRNTTRSQLNEMHPRTTFEFFDDFVRQVPVEATIEWIYNAGIDNLTVDPTVRTGVERGQIRLTAGDGDGATANDGSQLVCAIPVQCDSGGLEFSARLNITDVSENSLFVGFTDVSTLEEPCSVSGTTVTTTASDICGFVYDTAMTTPAWWAIGCDSDVDCSGNGTTGITPTDAGWVTLRVVVNAAGTEAKFYIDGVLVKTLEGVVVSPAVNLYFTVMANGNGSNTAAATVDVDYVQIRHNR